MSYYDQKQANWNIPIVFMGMVLALGLLLWSGAFSNIIIGDLPLSNHAIESHKNQTWNPGTIQSFMQTGCTPSEYACLNKDQTIAYCELKPGLSIGLIIGKTIKQVVTGFASSTRFWSEDVCN